MLAFLGIVLAVVVISFVMSTRESRSEARENMRRWTRPLIIPVVLLWAFIVWIGVSGWMNSR